MLHAGLLRPPGAGDAPSPVDWVTRFRELASSARDPRLKAYYAAGMVGADTALADTPLMALDVGTTGLDPLRDGIVSIGLVPIRLDIVRASASRYWLLRPRVPLGAESVTIHGITDTQIASAPDLDEVLGEFLQAIAGHVLVVHCSDIERQFLDGALAPALGNGSNSRSSTRWNSRPGCTAASAPRCGSGCADNKLKDCRFGWPRAVPVMACHGNGHTMH